MSPCCSLNRFSASSADLGAQAAILKVAPSTSGERQRITASRNGARLQVVWRELSCQLTAIGDELGSGGEAGLVARQEQHHVRELRRFA
jgi:hypothetical protein